MNQQETDASFPMTVVSPALRLTELTVGFGGVAALVDVSLTLERGQIGALIGPNGAGKSTLFHAVSGLVPVQSGLVFINGVSTKGLATHQLVGLGLARMSQHAALFERLTVKENLKLAMHVLRKQRQPVRSIHEWFDGVVQRLDLTSVLDTEAANLTMGLQRRVELARCLVAQPALLLLDEPAAGQTDVDWHCMAVAIDAMRRELGTAVFIIEHRLHWIWQLCDVCWVLDQGHLIAQGTARDVRQNPRVIDAYLGDAAHEWA